MGWSSQDALINDMTVNGRTNRAEIYKLITPAQTAGSWHDLGMLAGYPSANATATNNYAGTSLTYVSTNDTSTDPNGIPHGGNVSTLTKHLVNVLAMCGPAAAGAPWLLMLVDQLGYVRIQGASSGDVTGTGSRTVTMTALDTSARYSRGEGCRAYISSLVAPSGGGPNLSTFTYTNSAASPGTGKTCPYSVSCLAAPPATNIIHSGNAASRYGPFIPLAAGDTGIADIENFTLSGGSAYTGTSSVLVLHLVRPLMTIPIMTSGVAGERDLVNQLPSLPRIIDGAHLKLLMYSTGATTNNSPFMAALEFAWGGA